jgi:hypothetical protein
MQKPSDKILELIITSEIFNRKLNALTIPLIILFSVILAGWVFNQNAIGFICSVIFAVIATLWVKNIIKNVRYSLIVYKFYGKDQKQFFIDSAYAQKFFLHQATLVNEDGSNLDDIVEDILSDDVKKSEATAATVGAVELTIVNQPEKPIGSFLDVKIYEWLEFAGGVPGEKVRFDFFTTVTNMDTYTIPEGCILLHPGIVYKIARISGE